MGQTLYAATDNSGVFRTTDFGATWTPVNAGLSSFGQISVRDLAVDGNILLAAANTTDLYRSSNNGDTWSDIGYFPGKGGLWKVLGINGVIYAGTANGMSRSIDTGKTWQQINNGLPLPLVSSMIFTGKALYIGASYSVYRSSNGGDSWEWLGDGMPDFSKDALACTKSYVFAGGVQGGVYYTNDSLNKWTSLNEGIFSNWVEDLQISGDYLYAASFAGISRRSHTELTDVEHPGASELPIGFALEQNAPNPFSGATSIRYSLPASTHITLTVIDSYGRSIATPVDQFMPAGTHTATFDAGSLPPGLYLCIARSGRSMHAIRMIRN
jgi:hypothetical protein